MSDTGAESEQRSQSRFWIRGTSKDKPDGFVFEAIGAVCYIRTAKQYGVDSWMEAANTLGLSDIDARDLCAASNDSTWRTMDGRREPDPRLQSLREQLAEAVRLRIYIEPKLVLRFSQEELVVVVGALVSFPITQPEQGQPYLRALNAFRRAAGFQPFEATLENLEAALRALVSHRDRVAPEQRDAIESVAAKIASISLAQSRPRVDRQADEVFINRHPIFQSNLNTFAYELLAERENATGYLVVTQTILDRFTDQGLDQFVGNRLAFISVSQGAIKAGHCDAMTKERTILEVLDGAEPDKDLFRALTKLFNQGHRIAIADSLIRWSDYPLASIANVIKFDLADLGRLAIENRLETLKEVKSQLLADHVETHDDFEFARGVSFDYFQGSFFCKPHITGQVIPVNRLATMHLLVRVRDPEVDLQELGEMISQDLPLAFKLLELRSFQSVCKKRRRCTLSVNPKP